MLPRLRHLRSLALFAAVALSCVGPPALAAPSNPLCPNGPHGYTLCPNLGVSGGDVTNPYYNPKVLGIQGFPVSPAAPAINQALVWNGVQYVPSLPTALGRDIAIGADFTAINPLSPGVPQLFGAGGANFTLSITPGVLVGTARTATVFTVGSSNANATGTITFDLLMSTNDGITYPLVATAVIPASGRVASVGMALGIPLNARLIIRVSTSAALIFIGGLSATITSP